METIRILLQYAELIIPGVIVTVLLFITLKPNNRIRIILYISSFVLVRDALTPLELWKLGSIRGVLWIRLHTDGMFLIMFGMFSLLLVLLLYKFDIENRPSLIWFRNRVSIGVLSGIVGCILVVIPCYIMYQTADIGGRGGNVSSELIVPILIFALLGNLLEELLFRGYVLNYLNDRIASIHPAIGSGIVFAFCHVFLAITVTGIGWPLLVFTLWEGSIAGWVGYKYGIIPATLTHGGAIFLLASGLL